MFKPEVLIPCLYVVICVLAAGMIGMLVCIIKMQRKLETIYEALLLNFEDVDRTDHNVRSILNDTKTLLSEMMDIEETDKANSRLKELKLLVSRVDAVLDAMHVKIDDITKILVEKVLDSDMETFTQDRIVEAMNTPVDIEELEETIETPAFTRIMDKVVELECKEAAELGDGRCQDELDIHMISREEYLFGECHTYSKHKLWYSPDKDELQLSITMFNVQKFTPATAEFLGDGLRFFGVCSEDDPNVIYIRNHKLKADFMIEKASVT